MHCTYSYTHNHTPKHTHTHSSSVFLHKYEHSNKDSLAQIHRTMWQLAINTSQINSCHPPQQKKMYFLYLIFLHPITALYRCQMISAFESTIASRFMERGRGAMTTMFMSLCLSDCVYNFNEGTAALTSFHASAPKEEPSRHSTVVQITPS